MNFSWAASWSPCGRQKWQERIACLPGVQSSGAGYAVAVSRCTEFIIVYRLKESVEKNEAFSGIATMTFEPTCQQFVWHCKYSQPRMQKGKRCLYFSFLPILPKAKVKHPWIESLDTRFDRHLTLVTLPLAFLPHVVWNRTSLPARAAEPAERRAVSFPQAKPRHLFLFTICSAQRLCQMVLLTALA